MIGPPTGDFHPIYNAPMLGAHKALSADRKKTRPLKSTVKLGTKKMTSAQQRAELQREIWQLANEVRGAVDGWDFKVYVLETLFYAFIIPWFTVDGVNVFSGK